MAKDKCPECSYWEVKAPVKSKPSPYLEWLECGMSFDEAEQYCEHVNKHCADGHCVVKDEYDCQTREDR